MVLQIARRDDRPPRAVGCIEPAAERSELDTSRATDNVLKLQQKAECAVVRRGVELCADGAHLAAREEDLKGRQQRRRANLIELCSQRSESFLCAFR